MANRREFIRYSTVASLTTLSSLFSISAIAEKLAHMPRRKIPGSSESLGIVGYGNSSVFQQGDIERSSELMRVFLEHGGSYVDTSGNGRNTIGKIMRQHNAHDQLFLGTYIEGENLASMRAEIKQLLEIQGAGTLDLVLARSPLDFGRRRDEYQQLKADGLTKCVGVARSHQRFYPAMMNLMKDGAVDFVQVNYSMMEPEAENEIIPMAVEQGIAVVINRPFINGQYFGIIEDEKLPEWASEFDCYSWAQFSLKFILAHPGVNCVLTETSNPKHALENLEAAYGRMPDADTRKKMASLIQSFM